MAPGVLIRRRSNDGDKGAVGLSARRCGPSASGMWEPGRARSSRRVPAAGLRGSTRPSDSLEWRLDGTSVGGVSVKRKIVPAIDQKLLRIVLQNVCGEPQTIYHRRTGSLRKDGSLSGVAGVVKQFLPEILVSNQVELLRGGAITKPLIKLCF